MLTSVFVQQFLLQIQIFKSYGVNFIDHILQKYNNKMTYMCTYDLSKNNGR